MLGWTSMSLNIWAFRYSKRDMMSWNFMRGSSILYLISAPSLWFSTRKNSGGPSLITCSGILPFLISLRSFAYNALSESLLSGWKYPRSCGYRSRACLAVSLSPLMMVGVSLLMVLVVSVVLVREDLDPPKDPSEASFVGLSGLSPHASRTPVECLDSCPRFP